MKIQSKLLAILLVLSASTAHAATKTANLSVTATVSGTCTVSTSPVAFGTYDPTQPTDLTATGSVTVQCTSGTGYAVSLDAGQHEGSSGDITTRNMLANTSDLLPYQLYQDSGLTTVWGDTIGSNTLADTGTGADKIHNVYGKITKELSGIATGSYSDTVLVTITY